MFIWRLNVLSNYYDIHVHLGAHVYPDQTYCKRVLYLYDFFAFGHENLKSMEQYNWYKH